MPKNNAKGMSAALDRARKQQIKKVYPMLGTKGPIEDTTPIEDTSYMRDPNHPNNAWKKDVQRQELMKRPGLNK